MRIDVSTMQAAARALALRAVELSGAAQTEAVAAVTSSGLTRFADNRIHQNVAEENSEVSVRAVVGTRAGVASTNRTDDDSLKACCDAALAAAMSSPEDPGFPGLPAPEPVAGVSRTSSATCAFDAHARATAVNSIVDQSATRGLICAGGVKSTVQSLAVANSLGTDAVQSISGIRATVLSMGSNGGSGWASFVSRDASELAAAAVGDEAATLAERSEGPVDLPAGTYEVVLAPEAVADIIEFMGWLGLGAKPYEEGRSFMSGRLGEQILSKSVTLIDDALHSGALGTTFDFEGVPKKRVSLIENGIARGVVTDSYWAARMGAHNTGHALPAPNSYGPLPINLRMSAGDASIDELVSSIARGVYVTRFHYVNVEDPVPVTLTGMTRDGTFLIENGRLTAPLKNLRFTQSAIAALSDVRGVTSERLWIGSETNPVLVPGLALGSFTFTGQTT